MTFDGGRPYLQLPGQLQMIDGLPDSWDFNKVDPPAVEFLRNDKDRLTLITPLPLGPDPPVEVDVAVRATEWKGA